MDKEKVLDKIKKCLALGQSANEHEAAQALKQAQALMEKYEVNAVDIGNRAEISAYAFDVVYRQISADRRKFLKTCRARKPAHRTYLADQFCGGWIVGAYETVKKFEMSDEEKAIMDGYAKKEYPYMTEARTRDAKSSILQGSEIEYEALAKGMDSGKQVQLHHAMNGTDGVQQIVEQK